MLKVFFKLLFKFLIFYLLTSSYIYSITVAEVFSSIKKVNQANYPEEFSCSINSSITSFQFQNIPADMVLFNQTPELFLEAKKNASPKLVLTGVQPFYKNYFSPYEEFITKAGLFIGVDDYNSLNLLEKDFYFKAEEKPREIIVSLREKEGLPGDYAEYFYNKSYILKKAFFYENQEKSLEITFFNQKRGKFTFPKRMRVIIFNSNVLQKRKNKSQYFIDFRDCQAKK